MVNCGGGPSICFAAAADAVVGYGQVDSLESENIGVCCADFGYKFFQVSS